MNKKQFYKLAIITGSTYMGLSETENFGGYEMTTSYSATKKPQIIEDKICEMKKEEKK